MKLFISSHGHLASGIKSSLDILLGKSDNVYVFDAYVNEKSLNDILDNFYQKVSTDEQVILLSDMLGGSVNSIMYLYANKPNTILITGINLSLVLSLAMRDENVSESEILQLIEEARLGLQIVKETSISFIDDDFF